MSETFAPVSLSSLKDGIKLLTYIDQSKQLI